MSVPHPIPYQGSKRHLAEKILQYFPGNIHRLIEPFGGSAAVSLAALYDGKVNRVVLGDIDGPLISLWNRIIHESSDIADAYKLLWNEQRGKERVFYDHVRAEFNKTHRPDYFLYLLARCVKAAVRYNANGEFNQSPDNRRKGTHPDTMRKHIFAASALLNGRGEIQQADYRELLTRLLLGNDDIVYLDPPYQGVSRKRDPRYREGVAFNHFVETLGDLNAKGALFIVSYDGRTETKTYGDLLPSSLDLTHVELNAGRSSQATLLGRRATTFESLYLSPALAARLADSQVLIRSRNDVPIQLALLGN